MDDVKINAKSGEFNIDFRRLMSNWAGELHNYSVLGSCFWDSERVNVFGIYALHMWEFGLRSHY